MKTRIVRWGVMAGGLALLASCGGSLSNSQDTPDAPTNVTMQAGDQAVVMTWDNQPGVSYWVFCASDPSITADNWVTLPNPLSVQNLTSPAVVGGPTNGTTGSLTSGSPGSVLSTANTLVNGTQYWCVVNGRYGSKKGGSASAALSATPRPAGATWAAEPPFTGFNLSAVSFGDDHVVLVGDAGNIYWSKDDVTWTQVAPAVTTNNLRGMVMSNGRFVAVGDAGAIVTSTDGENWSSAGSGVTNTLRGVAELGSTYVAVGDGGAMLTSGNGTNWTVGTSGTTQDLLGVGVDAGATTVIAVGRNGTILRSTDGLNWTQIPSPVTTDLRSVTYGAYQSTTSRFVAVGANGTMITSTDGTSWSVLTPVTNNTLNFITYNSQFVAVGNGGTVVYSPDGLNWSVTNGGVSSDLFGVTFALHRYKAAGAGGSAPASF